MSEKKIHFANFNVTFGSSNDPMLKRFESVIYPAFTDLDFRQQPIRWGRYLLDDVRVRKIHGEYVLVGNIVKMSRDDIMEAWRCAQPLLTRFGRAALCYSRFMLFLRNHRMILVRNRSDSPDIRNFQKAVRETINSYIRFKAGNRQRIPRSEQANINVVSIPYKCRLDEAIGEYDEIEWMQIVFFPLNNDIDQDPMNNYIREQLEKLDSKWASLKIQSPKSREEVVRVFEDTKGKAEISLKIRDAKGNCRQIDEESLEGAKIVEYEGDIGADTDEMFAECAIESGVISDGSSENVAEYIEIQNIFEQMRKVVEGHERVPER